MRRFWPALLAFLGVACITAAIAVPLWLVPQLRVVPLDLDITSDSTTVPADGSTGERFPAVIFDRCSVSEDEARTLDAHLTQQRRTVVVDPSDRRQATVQSAQTVLIDRTRDADGEETEPEVADAGAERQCDDGLLTANIDRVSLNRKSSAPNGAVSSLQLEAVPEGGSVNDVSVDLPDRKGFQYKFGFDVQKGEYYYYDLNTRQDQPAKFVDEKVIDGVTTYHFVSEVPETDLSSLPNAQQTSALGTMLTMPASWWGISGRGVDEDDLITMHRYASATRHVWVEPETGTIVDGREDQRQYFRSPDQSEGVPEAVRDFRMDALNATFQWTDETISYQANNAEKYMGQLRLGNFWLPLILGILGVLLLLAWAVLFWRGRRRDDDVDTDGDGPDADGPDAGATDGGPDAPADDSPTSLIKRDPDGAAAAGSAAAGAAGAAGIAGAHAPDSEADASNSSAHRAGPGLDPWDRPTEKIPRITDGPRHAAPRDGDGFRPVDDDDSATRDFRRPEDRPDV